MEEVVHRMRLQEVPFVQIKDGRKVIEIRLNDEKRQLIQIGDSIEFVLVNDETRQIQVKVNSLHQFKTFKELFEAFPSEDLGFESSVEYNSLYEYYSPEDEQKYGVLAIGIELIK